MLEVKSGQKKPKGCQSVPARGDAGEVNGPPRDGSDATAQVVDAQLAYDIGEQRFQQGGRGLAQQTRRERQSAPINFVVAESRTLAGCVNAGPSPRLAAAD